MPDTRSHRGPDPHDARAFDAESIPALRAAVDELSWLLERGYAIHASLKLVGDRWGLTERQRKAVARCACGASALATRICHRVEPEDVAGQPVVLDGFNVLTTLEAALGGAVVLVGRDGCLRDIAGVHGNYRKVEETVPAAILVGETLEELDAGRCTWLLDRPVSNSGRLGALLRTLAEERGWDWQVELPFTADPVLASSPEVVATADSVVLDACAGWLNLARFTAELHIPRAHLVDLSSIASG